jgi:hypothetical protein
MSFITKAGEQPGEKDEGNEGEEQQQGGLRTKEHCIVLAERIPAHRVHAFMFGYQIADISDLIKATIPFELARISPIFCLQPLSQPPLDRPIATQFHQSRPRVSLCLF